MKSIRFLSGLVFLISFVLVACQSATAPEQSAADMMEGNADYGAFSQALAKLEMDDVGKDSSLTLFVPTTDAFEAFAEAQGVSLEELLESPELEAILSYHMAQGLYTSEVLLSLNELETLTGESISVESEDGRVILNGDTNVIVADLKARNVVIHVVDAVLTPNAAQPTIVEIAASDERFSTLVAAVQAAGLVDTLNSDGPFTVFAPTNDAFEVLLSDLGLSAEELLADTDLLTTVLTYHVVASEFFAKHVLAASTLRTLQGEDITVDAENVKVNDSNLIATDIDASNGVIHVIDAVLLPPSLSSQEPGTIVEIAAATEDLSILVAAVQAAGLVDTLNGEGPFTVFAPTNAAFEALLSELELSAEELLGNKDLLTTVLTYHVIAGELFANDVLSRESLSTVQGEDIIVDAANLKLNDSNIIATDIEASNGVVHLIDAVLLPPSLTEEPTPSIVDVVVNNPDFSILKAAVIKADLVDALSAEGPFTVFAPTNAAFEALAESLHIKVEDLLELPNLKDILLYHVAAGALDAATIAKHDAVKTLQGDLIRVEVSHGNVVLNGSVTVTSADIMVSNGIIHVIDGVLLPH